jgi:NADH-quinone oxidoreductase subunit M
MIGSFALFAAAFPIVTLALLSVTSRQRPLMRAIALVSGIASLVVVTALLIAVAQSGSASPSPIVNVPWIEMLGARLRLAIEPLGALMCWITAFSTILGVAASVREFSHKKEEGPGECFHYQLLFLIQAALYIFFTARDLLLLFIAYETVLIPMYLLILIWGGKNRVYASLKFVLFTLFGSLPMLLSIAALAVYSWQHLGYMTLDLDVLKTLSLSRSTSLWLFAGFALAFLVKVPLWPLHTWLPDAHTEAPTAGSIVLAGVLLKMGTYGLAAIAIPLFPSAARDAAPLLQSFAIVGIIFGALASLAQTDAKRLIAYSSVSHMAYVVLGLFAFNREAWLGAILQMAAHGVSTGALFYFVGAIYHRRHDRELDSFGGLATLSPGLTAWTAVAVFSSTALPGTAGFAAELLVLFGVFSAKPLLAILAVPAVILSAAYMLKFFRAIAFGKATPEFHSSWNGAGPDEIAAMALCALLLVFVGVAPWCAVYSWMAPAADLFLRGIP